MDVRTYVSTSIREPLDAVSPLLAAGLAQQFHEGLLKNVLVAEAAIKREAAQALVLAFR